MPSAKQDAELMQTLELVGRRGFAYAWQMLRNQDDAVQATLAAFRNIVGGEVQEYRKLMAESREQSLDQMIDEARELGADAIINVRLVTSMIGQGMAEILVYGTAVRVEKVQ